MFHKNDHIFKSYSSAWGKGQFEVIWGDKLAYHSYKLGLSHIRLNYYSKFKRSIALSFLSTISDRDENNI